MKHRLPELPFPKNSLEPFISLETIDFHYGKHHKGYVDKLNSLIVGTQFENQALEDIILNATGPVFNNAAQVWNHNFFWKCLSPFRREMSPVMLSRIERDFRSVEVFLEDMVRDGMDFFGSGYLWLVNDEGVLKLEATQNAESPLRQGKTPLLTCDLWEHAYYIDYRNEREKFIRSFIEVIDWDFAESNFNESFRRVA